VGWTLLGTGAIASLATKGTTQAAMVGFTSYMAADMATQTVTRMMTTEGLGWSARRDHIRRAAEARRVN
jgi:hypothetical protein